MIKIIYLVIAEKLTSEGKKDSKGVLEWQKRLDQYLVSHRAAWKSVKHFVTVVGEPIYETWLEYTNHAAFDEDAEKVKEFARDPEWQELVSHMNLFFERVNSRLVRDV